MMELYVHFPFCKKKCTYCDFASFAQMESFMDPYLDALVREAEMILPEITEPVETVYFGGGTPSLLPPRALRQLLLRLRRVLPLDRVSEWTSEANPGTLTPDWLKAARDGGINRISLGMQAAQDALLSLLGRIHRFSEVESSVSMVRDAGFQNLNLDLMFGIPTQTPSDWEKTLEAALRLSPEHLSAYGLIPEEGTALWDDLQRGRLALPSEEEERQMYDLLLSFTAKQGYPQYEISNFARPGWECRHNIGYWRQTEYIGLGLSAASMIGKTRGHPGVQYLRRTNTSQFSRYLREIREGRLPIAEQSRIPPEEARFETMMLGLRMNRGVREDDFFAWHGISLADCYGTKLERLGQEGLLIHESGAWRLTRRGMDLQNMALVELMED